MRRPHPFIALLLACFSWPGPTATAQTAPARDHDIVPEDYFDIASIRECAVSPEGLRAAWVESRWGRGKEGRKNDLWVVSLETKERLRLTFGGFGASHPTWGPDGEWIYFAGRSRRAGEEEPPHDGSQQVWRIRPAGGDPFPVTRVGKGIALYDLARDGRTLVYAKGEEVYADEWKELRKEYSDLEYGHGISTQHSLWRLDLESWRTEKLLAADRVIHELDLTPDGGRVALVTTADNELIFKEGWSQVEVLHLEGGEVEVLTSQAWRGEHPSPYGWLEEVCWADDGGALAFSIAFDGYARRIYVAEWGAAGAALREVARPGLAAHAGGLKWLPGARTLCFAAEEKARVRVAAVEGLRRGGQGATRVLTPGELVVGAFDFNGSGEILVASVETTDRLNDLYLFAGGGFLRITDLNPQVDRWRLPQISITDWIGGDGDRVEGILELPPDYRAEDGPLPLIVELHGGPTGATYYRLRLWIYGRALMPSNGYALISPNYHGSTGYGDEFTSKLIGRENDIEVADILAGIQHLVDRGIADPERIGVMGWSNGGFLTNCVIGAAPELFKAASSGAGLLDMAMQWATEDTPGHVINYMEGLPWEDPEAYREGSPLYHLARVRTPTLIHTGGEDERMPAIHSRGLYRALRHYLNVPVELIVYPGEGHGLSTYENRMAKMRWDLAWFDRYLLGKEPGETE